MRGSKSIVLAAVAAVLVAGCGSDPAVADRADDEHLLNYGDSDRAALDSGRADLELTASASAVVDGGAEMAIEFRVLDKPEIIDPTVTFDLPPGVTVPAPPVGG